MELQFKTRKLQRILSDDRQLSKHYSNIKATLMNRLTELQAADNLSFITHKPPPRKHKLSGEYEGCWSVDVSANYRLIFRPIETSITDETKIKGIVILDILDPH